MNPIDDIYEPETLGEILLETYGVSPSRGCLPPDDPQTTFRFESWFPSAFMPIEEIGENLPAILRNGTLASELKQIPICDGNFIASIPEKGARLLMVRLAFLAHGYVWEDWRNGNARDVLPANLAVPLRALALRFGFCPTLNYSNYALWNWKRKDVKEPVVPENLKLIQNFLGGDSEEWFVVLHVAIEQAAAPLLLSAWELGEVIRVRHTRAILFCLKTIASALENINAIMRRMPERCDPREYFQFVRPYLYGWTDKKIFPNGMLYKGKDLAEDEFLVFPGETGAQSSIVPCLDRVLGVVHEPSPLSEHLHEMLHVCTSRKHRNFILALEERPSLSQATASLYGVDIVKEYWNCRNRMAEFRGIHLEYASRYIQKQAHGVSENLTYLGAVGSGGTQYMPSLAKHKQETGELH